MSTLTIIYNLKNNTKEEICKFLNNAGGNIISITENTQNDILPNWLDKYNPTVSEYSNKSLLFKSKIKFNKKYAIINLPNNSAIYYNKTLDGWVTSKKNKDYISSLFNNNDIDNESDISYDDYLSELSDCDELDISNNYNVLDGLNYTYYKNGIIIIPNKSHKKYGQSYFHNGFWNKYLNGWVFSKKQEQTLKEKGAKYKNYNVGQINNVSLSY